MAEPITSTMYICSGTTYGDAETQTVVSGAGISVYIGSANDSYAGNGTLYNTGIQTPLKVYIRSGGVLESALFSANANTTYRNIEVYNGGTAENVKLTGMSWRMYVNSNGVANNITVNQNCMLEARIGAQISNITLNGVRSKNRMGTCYNNAATAVNVTINDYARMTMTAVYNTAGNVLSGYASATNVLVNAGGTLQITAGVATDITATAAGAAVVFAKDTNSTHVISSAVVAGINNNVVDGNLYSIVSGVTSVMEGASLIGSAASGFSIESGLTIGFSDGVELQNAKVQNGGSALILSGGAASSTVIYDGGLLTISQDGVASDTDVSGGTLNIVSGNVFGSTVVRNGGYVSADMYNAVVNGTMTILDGGVAEKTAIGGITDVSSGGLLSAIRILNNGNIRVLDGGVVSGGWMDAGVIGKTYPQINISSGGIVYGVTGVVRNRTYVQDGGLLISGGGTRNYIEVRSGGMASDCYIAGSSGYNGNFTLLDGAEARNTTVRAYGAMTVSGTARSNTVLANGILYARSVVIDTTVNDGGALSVQSGAVLGGVNNSVAAGLIDFDGVVQTSAAMTGSAADGFVIDSGFAIGFTSGIELRNARINDGGKVNITSAKVTDAVLENGANLTLSAAEWNLTSAVNAGNAGMDLASYINGAEFVGVGTFDIDIRDFSGDTGVVLADGVIGAGTITVNGDELAEKYYNQASNIFVNIDNTTQLQLTTRAATDADFKKITGETSFVAEDKIAATNGSSVYYGIMDENTTATKFVAADAILSGDVTLKLDGISNAAAVIYGGGSDTALDGSVDVNFMNGQLAALMGGATTNTGSIANANIDLAGGHATVVYGAGRGNVAGNVVINASSGSEISGQTYGGGVLLSTATADLVIGGDVTLNLDGGTFGSDIVGGCRVNGGSAGAGIISGTVALNVSGGTLAASKSVYGGGFAASNGAADTEIDVQSGVTINWNGGTMAGEAANGRGIFGGALAANGATAQVASVNIAVVDGSVTNIFGGGWSQSGAASNVTGDVNITISGGSVANVFGGGAHADGEAGTTSVGGDVTITVSGGSVNKIYAAGQQEGDEIAGTANVVFTGSTDFASEVSGAGYNGANADAMAYFTFDGYTGSFTGSIANFDAINVSGETGATLTGAEIGNSAWDFDLAANTGAATLLTWSDAETIGTSLELGVSTSNVVDTGWNLIAGGDGTDFASVAYKLAIDDSAAIDLELGTAVSGTGTVFDGYTLYAEENTLKFGVVAGN